MSKDSKYINLSLKDLQEAYAKKKYPVKKFGLFGVRSQSPVLDFFNDLVGWYAVDDNGVWTYAAYNATTKPGIASLKDFSNPNGCAVVVPGFYSNLFVLGYHKNNPKHPAFVENINAPAIRVWRDKNKDDTIQIGGKVYVGYFGINLHRADEKIITQTVGLWSAGCQVIQRATSLMALRKKAKESGLPAFDYALFDQADILRQ